MYSAHLLRISFLFVYILPCLSLIQFINNNIDVFIILKTEFGLFNNLLMNKVTKLYVQKDNIVY